MEKPNVSQNPTVPTQESPAEPGNVCGESWHYALRIHEGRLARELEPLAAFEIAFSANDPSYLANVGEWVDSGDFGVAFSEVSGDFESMSAQGLIGTKNQNAISTMLERASRYYDEAVAMFTWMGASNYAPARQEDPANRETVRKSIEAALRNLRCAQEASWVVGLYTKNKRSTKGWITPRPAGPTAPGEAQIVPEALPGVEVEPEIDLEPEYGDYGDLYDEAEPEPEPPAKKSNTILLVGAAAVAFLVLSRK